MQCIQLCAVLSAAVKSMNDRQTFEWNEYLIIVNEEIWWFIKWIDNVKEDFKSVLQNEIA